jgi:phenylacetate-CoA ligase
MAMEGADVMIDPTRRGVDRSRRVEALYARMYREVLYPVWEKRIRGRATQEHLGYLEATQWLEPEAVAKIQLDALRRLLSHAGANVPYYRELFAQERFDPRGVDSRADLCALPLLTKDIIRERYADLVDPAHHGKNLKKGTSGSTGTPLKFEYSHESESWRQATRLRGYRWAGLIEGMPTFYYWAQVHTPRGAAGVKLRLDRAIRREVYVDSMRQTEETMLASVALFRRLRPHLVVGYTQAMAAFARFILDRGLRDWGDVPVICGAEAVLLADRRALERAFGPDVFETYGARETMLMGAECSAHAGLHLSEENLVVEVTTHAGAALAAPGEPGDVAVTDLHNDGMPFIRYVNGDVASMAEEAPCACGRGLRRLLRVEGRRADTLRDPHGEAIPGIVVHVLFSDARQEIVKAFQAVQRPSGAVVLKVVRGRDFAEAAFSTQIARFTEYLRGLPLSVEFHDAIPPSPTGKRRTVIVERA